MQRVVWLESLRAEAGWICSYSSRSCARFSFQGRNSLCLELCHNSAAFSHCAGREACSKGCWLRGSRGLARCFSRLSTHYTNPIPREFEAGPSLGWAGEAAEPRSGWATVISVWMAVIWLIGICKGDFRPWVKWPRQWSDQSNGWFYLSLPGRLAWILMGWCMVDYEENVFSPVA